MNLGKSLINPLRECPHRVLILRIKNYGEESIIIIYDYLCFNTKSALQFKSFYQFLDKNGASTPGSEYSKKKALEEFPQYLLLILRMKYQVLDTRCNISNQTSFKIPKFDVNLKIGFKVLGMPKGSS